MLRTPSVRLVLGLLTLCAELVAVLTGHLLLLAGLMLLACAAFWALPNIWTALMTGVLVLGLGAAASRPEIRADLWLLPGAATLLTGMLLLTSHRRALAEVARTQNVIRALEKGSAELADARDTGSVIRAGVQTLDRLRVAVNLAFVAYRRGTPQVLGARGAFTELLGKPILPGNGNSDSLSVQADHWVAERTLSQIPREQRQFFLSIPVEGVSGQQLGVLLLARPRLRQSERQSDFLPAERSVIAAFARLFGSALGQWQAIRELRDANELTLRSLGAALEHRDDETGATPRGW